MQNRGYEVIKDEIKNELKGYFKDKIGSFSIYEQTDTPYTMFSMQFTMYNYFNIVLNYDRGAFGCAIINGEVGISLKSSQKWYDKADMTIFLKELEQQIELRIPDKFLEFHGWK
ncbi:hypothetical protein QGM71_16885 [Virgibacillus sp. C22-A2]|uniref:DUF4304 domain-containing protein n=1 Tax=Virgibacillus tibetensis TaxID=3042313 RepID=A0ABU6KL73_9BACI|nr:hypothetical protein [Virgibacillus sp. C22-A2]